eukprot:365067-Chlamydomonas_euryale.AAC.4
MATTQGQPTLAAVKSIPHAIVAAVALVMGSKWLLMLAAVLMWQCQAREPITDWAPSLHAELSPRKRCAHLAWLTPCISRHMPWVAKMVCACSRLVNCQPGTLLL